MGLAAHSGKRLPPFGNLNENAYAIFGFEPQFFVCKHDPPPRYAIFPKRPKPSHRGILTTTLVGTTSLHN